VKIKLTEFDEEASYFTSIMENRETDRHFLPTRAFRKTYSDFYDKYINEVLIGITKSDLSQNGYENFNRTIEARLKKKSIGNKINIISFFGDKDVNLQELISFEDINLLADFEQRYNDHMVSCPFTLKFRSDTYSASNILSDIQSTYEDFISTLKTANILGYVPAYVSHRDLDGFIRLYTDYGTNIDTPIGKLNYIPLMIDCKNSLPDKFKRSLAKLRQLKIAYLKDGYYLSYYGFGVGTPRVSQKRNIDRTLAKEFLLSFLGFDIVGGSHARISGGGGGGSSDEKSTGVFHSDDFNYHLTRVPSKLYPRIKPQNFADQTDYLLSVNQRMVKEREVAQTELERRPEAFEYVESYK
jgi:hypothetical protein